MLATDAYLIALRFIHIVFGVAWAGSLFLLVVFVQPSARSIGPAGAPFMRELLGRRRLGDWILSLAAVTIAGGLLLYWERWQDVGSLGDWVGTRYGLGLTIGALAAIVAFLFGLFGTRPNVVRLMALAGRIEEAGGQPASDQAREVQRIQTRLQAFARTSLALVAIAVIAMATARYW